MAPRGMVPGTIRHEGRRLRFAVSQNAAAPGPNGTGSPAHPDSPRPGGTESGHRWAVNLHGYFAGGEMYWRESADLAARMGWWVVNPSLPGFGGSQPIPWARLSLAALADSVVTVLDHLGADQVVLLGHSMGCAVAVALADRFPDRVLGIVYRDGAATPRWRDRRGLVPALMAPFLPDLAGPLDLVMATALDVPDLLIGKSGSTVSGLVPDVRRNIGTLGRTAPVASLLMTWDLRDEIRRLVAERSLPLLAEWGCFDRITHEWTAAELSECAGVPVHWVPGGHSWMLARPRSQGDLLLHMPWGREFLAQVEDRAASLPAP